LKDAWRKMRQENEGEILWLKTTTNI
jgi:hypothetical protein